jgi:NAD(P)-dependent dehydrogenase (short-subunit alcohol dehydrogenase family)
MGALEGKTALITGGSSGIGLATARLFKSEGARVAVVDLQSPPAGVADLYIAADVGDPSAWIEIVQQVERDLGGIDVGYLNAGVTTGEAQITEITDEAYRRIMRVNVDGVFFGARALVPAMERRGGGAIVATASLAGLGPMESDSVYSMTKHAVVGLTRSLAGVLESRGITINCVCPGITDTPLVGEARESLRESGFPLIPPEDIARAALLAATAGTTGQAYPVQPGREPEPYKFRGVPGPRVEGAEGMKPPDIFFADQLKP